MRKPSQRMRTDMTNEAMLKLLREKNPELKLYSVFDAEFARYGCVLNAETVSLPVFWTPCRFRSRETATGRRFPNWRRWM